MIRWEVYVAWVKFSEFISKILKPEPDVTRVDRKPKFTIGTKCKINGRTYRYIKKGK